LLHPRGGGVPKFVVHLMQIITLADPAC